MTERHFITLGEAAKLTGKSKPTISKALKGGKISYVEKTENGYKLDPSEVQRVYPFITTTEPVETGVSLEGKILEERLNALEQRLRDKETMIDELKKERDAWKNQNVALLEDKRQREAIFTKQQQEHIEIHKAYVEQKATNDKLQENLNKTHQHYNDAEAQRKQANSKLDKVKSHWLGRWVVK